jgi:hypothetical protein
MYTIKIPSALFYTYATINTDGGFSVRLVRDLE